MFKLREENLLKSCETNEDEARMRRPAAVCGSPCRHSYVRQYRNSRLEAYKRKPPTHRRKEAMQPHSGPASVANGTGLEVIQLESRPTTGLDRTGVDWGVVGPIPTVTNTLT